MTWSVRNVLEPSHCPQVFGLPDVNRCGVRMKRTVGACEDLMTWSARNVLEPSHCRESEVKQHRSKTGKAKAIDWHRARLIRTHVHTTRLHVCDVLAGISVGRATAGV
jgi:hypothetical protein